MTRTTHVATLTGLLDLRAPNVEAISLRDIALKLATKNRWGGVLEPPLSVAQHSVLVADALPQRLRIWGLLHDAHEAFLGDITTPNETLMDEAFPGFARWLGNYKTLVDLAIRRALGVPEPSIDDRAAVHEADLRMAATEWHSLMPAACGPNPIPAERYRRIGIKPMAWPDAESRFRQAVEQELAMKSWELAA